MPPPRSDSPCASGDEKAYEDLPKKSGRWRWIIRGDDSAVIFTEEPPAVVRPIPLTVSAVRLGSHNWDARFKTVSYLAHVQALRSSPTPEAVLLNEHGEVASAASANIFWRKGDRLFTPAHEPRRVVVVASCVGSSSPGVRWRKVISCSMNWWARMKFS